MRMYYLSLLVSFRQKYTFQPSVCNGCHDILMMSFGISNVAILDINGVDYHCIICRIKKIKP